MRKNHNFDLLPPIVGFAGEIFLDIAIFGMISDFRFKGFSPFYRLPNPNRDFIKIASSPM